MTRNLLLVVASFLFLFFSSTTTRIITTTEALAPPHPLYFAQYESLDAYRRRHNLTHYSYTPRHYPADHCRFLTEEQCQRDDEAAASAKKRRQQLIAPRSKYERQLNPTTGTIQILVLLRYFPEHAGILNELPDKNYFDTLLNGVGSSAVNPIGGIGEWLSMNSLQQFNVQFVVQDWTVTEESEAQYSGGQAARLSPLRVQDIFRDELDKLDSSGFDFAPFDSNRDGYLDGVMVFHSGVPAELGEAPCSTDYLQRIWAQAARGPDPEGWKSSDGKYTLDGFTVSGAFTRPLCSEDGTNTRVYTPTHMAIHAHELGHTWNLDDYYDTTPGETGVAGIGAFDIMCQAYGWNFDGARPGYLSAFTKMKSGWLEPIEIVQDGLYAIQPIELSGMAYKISQPYPEGEYLLIESRYPYRWNDDWTGQGIIIYHVDENAPLQSARGYPGKAGFPAAHYQIAVLQKDGLYDIEKNVNLGDAGDFWVLNDELGPGPNTWPNTDSIQGAQTPTGLTIKITSEPSLITQFQISGFQKRAGGGTGMAPGLGATTGGSGGGATTSTIPGTSTTTGGMWNNPLSTNTAASSSGAMRSSLSWAVIIAMVVTASCTMMVSSILWS